MALDPAIVLYEFSANRTIFVGKTIRGRRSILLLVRGGFGSGTLKPGYFDDDDVFTPMDPGLELTTRGILEAPTGTGMKFGIELSGSTTPSLDVFVLADSFQLSDET